MAVSTPESFCIPVRRALFATANATTPAVGISYMNKTKENGLSRRRMMLVTGGAVAGAGALIAAPARKAIKSVARGVAVNTGIGRGFFSLANATYQEWLNEVGSTFSLGGRTNVRLVGVRALPTSGAKPQGVRAQGFVALFDPVTRQALPTDIIYTATHPNYGPMQLFLAGTSDPRTPGRMAAVFN
jgi:hypothetical protein